jgi:hypothetical protein
MLQPVSKRKSSEANVGETAQQESNTKNETKKLSCGEKSSKIQTHSEGRMGLFVDKDRGIKSNREKTCRTNDQKKVNQATQNCNGSTFGQTLNPERDSSSQEWNKNGQQDRKLRNIHEFQSLKRLSQTNKRKYEIEILASDVPTAWMRYFRPTGFSIVNPECSAYMLDEQSGEITPSFRKGDRASNNDGIVPWNKGRESGRSIKGAGYFDKGGASRYFKTIQNNLESKRFLYCAKASKKERNMGLEGFEEKITKITNQYEMERKDGTIRKLAKKQNIHPTCKPLKLMEYLCILTRTPTGGIVLDPFAGSGTTGMACKKTGRDYILIEKEVEYVSIAKSRIKSIQKLLPLL